MGQTDISADNAVFILLSFEGPDPYSLAGGLGVRVTNLCNTITKKGFPAHLFFIGDPKRNGEEPINDGQLVLHRWCQWISEYYPNGVYHGENDKLRDYTASIPNWVTQNVIKPALNDSRMVIVLAEEWQTAEAVIRLHEQLKTAGVRDQVVIFWNANNTFGFDRIDWKRLAAAATITTVSRYMKHIMWGVGVNPLVISNGIPKCLLDRVDESASRRLREVLGAETVVAKIARFDPDKCWDMAIEAMARLKAQCMDTLLVARGGIEAHGEEVLARARALGLKITDVNAKGETLNDYFEAVTCHDGTDILNIHFYCPQDFLRLIYHSSDAVLANSGHEPFGLVGLETMAAGGIAFIGSTGEDYAVPFRNSIVLETGDPKEIEADLMYLRRYPEEGEKMRRAARQTAREFTWDRVIENLIRKLEYQARAQGLVVPMEEERPTEKPEEKNETSIISNTAKSVEVVAPIGPVNSTGRSETVRIVLN